MTIRSVITALTGLSLLATAALAQTSEPATSGGEDLMAAVTGNPEAGARVFRGCQSCHTIDKDGPHRVGPNLWGIFGAEPASKEGYSYSKALQEADIPVWNVEHLSGFLANPRQYVPGTKMAYAGVKKEEDLANVIAYLAQNSEHGQSQ